jgi:hypothetical protein
MTTTIDDALRSRLSEIIGDVIDEHMAKSADKPWDIDSVIDDVKERLSRRKECPPALANLFDDRVLYQALDDALGNPAGEEK